MITQTISTLARNDFRLIRRDSFLAGLFIYPIMHVLIMRFGLSGLTAWAARQFNFDLQPYHTLILSYFMVMVNPLLIGAAAGFLLIEERDEQTLTVMLVSPIPIRTFLRYRALLTAVMSFTITVVTIPFIKVIPLTWWQVLAVGVLTMPIAAAVAYFVIGFAHNKIQAFGLMKILGFLMITPMAAWFIPDPWQWLAGIFTPYFSIRAFWEMMAGNAGSWLYLLAGLLINALAMWFLIRRFEKSVYQ